MEWCSGYGRVAAFSPVTSPDRRRLLSEPEVRTQHSGEQIIGPSAHVVLKWMILLTMIVIGITVGSHLWMTDMQARGVDPGWIVIIRALAISLATMLVVLVYVLGWTELFQGWHHRSGGTNAFFTLALIFTLIVGSVLICVTDPFVRADMRRSRA